MEYEKVEINSERWFDLTLLLNEEFRDINGYEGLYQVSNYGRVKSLQKYNAISKKYYNREKILKNLPHKGGYLKVGLNKDGKKKCHLIQQIVGKTFIPNPNNLLEINHKDTNKYNNMFFNLEWCTRSENMKHAFENGKCNSQLSHLKKVIQNNKKAILQYTLNNEFIKKWDSSAQIEKELGYLHGNISKCCLNKKHCLTAYGYKWKYEKEM